MKFNLVWTTQVTGSIEIEAEDYESAKDIGSVQVLQSLESDGYKADLLDID